MSRLLTALFALAVLAGCASTEPRYVYDDGGGDYYYGSAADAPYAGGGHVHPAYVGTWGYYGGFWPSYGYYDAYYSPWGYRYWWPYSGVDYVIYDPPGRHYRRDGDRTRDVAAVGALQTQRGAGPAIAPRRAALVGGRPGPWRDDAYAIDRAPPARGSRQVTPFVNRVPGSDTFVTRGPAPSGVPARGSVGVMTRSMGPAPAAVPARAGIPSSAPARRVSSGER